MDTLSDFDVNLKKITSIVGARPNFVKLAPLHRQLAQVFDHRVIHTGQHYDYSLSGVFFREFRLPKPYLNLGVGSGPPGWQTGEMIKKVEKALNEAAPDLVIVYGDTNSTLAGAIAAVKMGIRIAHVEAGVRSFDMTMPEEANRILTDHVSEYLFCPTRKAVENLSHEGLRSKTFLTGDVMVEPLLKTTRFASARNILEKYSLTMKGYSLLTLHRAENTNNVEVLKDIVDNLVRMDEKVVFPMHPRTRKALEDSGLMGHIKRASNLEVIEPVPYGKFIMLEKCADRILTDSGGVQKEAYILGVPCITLRDRTEWPETLVSGWNVLVGHSYRKLRFSMRQRPSENRDPSLFGDTQASTRITKLLSHNMMR